MPCPRCGSTSRQYVEPGRWQCVRVSTNPGYVVPAGWSGGPGLTNPAAGPGIIWHPERYVGGTTSVCGTAYDVPDAELTDAERIPSSRTLAANAAVDRALPRLEPVPHPGPLPYDAYVDAYCFAGLVPYGLVPAIVLWFAFGFQHFAGAVVLGCIPYGLVLGRWGWRAKRLREEHAAALRAWEERDRAIAARERERAAMFAAL